MTDAAMLVSANRAFVIAPAGCGKTELIAQSVHHDSSHRSLVLTHTYAGVDSLRKRLKAVGAKASSYEVDTIARWSLRLALSFPGTSGIITERPVNDQWNDVYRAASRILLIRAIQTVVRASFNSVYVDEYQDCSPLQHDIVLKLAEILPTRILGDPLQGIFDFGGSEIVDWQLHVRPHFAELPSLSEPHRWVEKNPTLGNWLLRVRESLESQQALDLRTAPNGCIRFVQLPTDPTQHGNIQRETCMSAACRSGENLIAIHNWEAQCHKIARESGGKFRSLETIECYEVLKAGRGFEECPDWSKLVRTNLSLAVLADKDQKDLEGCGGI